MDNFNDVLIIMPAYNEETTIGTVIKDLKNSGYKKILVIDDGSKDNTYEIASGLGVYTARHILNRGLGSALATGLEIAQILDFDMVVTFDADGQHKVGDIIKLIEPLKKNEADVAIGSRMSSITMMPKARLLYNAIANLITFIFYGYSSADTQSGLRAFNKRAYKLVDISSSKMECSSEIIYKIRKSGLKLKQVKIEPIYTDYSLSKGQSLFMGVKTFFRLIVDRLLKED